LSIGIPIEAGFSDSDSDSGSWVGERRNRVQIEVDYVRIYQPIKSLPQAVTEEATLECSVTRNDVMLDLLEGMFVPVFFVKEILRRLMNWLI
jgi:hypothetical protein